MSLKTDDFIERLAAGVEPVAPLPRPWRRAATWLVGATVYIGILAMMMTSSVDVSANGVAWRFVLPQVAAIVVSGAAAAAAFASIVPGASPRAVLWPAAAVALWIGTLLVGSVQEWQTTGAVGLAPQREWLCVAMIGLGGALPALAMVQMLRQGAPLTPRVTSALVVLAAAGLANVGACISHPHASSAVVLIWHGATVVSLVAVSTWAGRFVFSWARLSHPSR
ncbi:MAG: NrsF family protein [Vicinamibacterales bacterium]